jgi:threonine dehydrogenase-like Zn-dependent dehydrogenase
MPMMEMFDRGVQLRMGQATSSAGSTIDALGLRQRRPAGVVGFATHHLSLEQARHGYEIFRNKEDGCIKVVLQP